MAAVTAFDQVLAAEPPRRELGPDVVRAVALIGVVVMNYHGYVNGANAAAGPDSTLFERWFDPFRGVLSTRFAATFVLVAGVGVTLLTRRAVAELDTAAVSAHRWRLVRRGLTLYGLGFVLEWIWPGTIIFFYGAYFVLGATLITLATRWIIVTGAVAAAGAAAVQVWSRVQTNAGHDTGWLFPAELDSFRNLMLRTFLGYTHPVLPWLAFFCAGIVLGRVLPRLDALRWRLVGVAAAVLAATYALNAVVWRVVDEQTSVWRTVTSTRPMDRSLLYTAGTLATALIAYCLLSWWAERRADTFAVDVLGRAGQLSLSIYLAHIFVFNAAVDWFGWIGADGLGTALAFALVFWVGALLMASNWHRALGMGPAERLYRLLGG